MSQIASDVQSAATVPTGLCHVLTPNNPVKAEPAQNSPALTESMPIASIITTKLDEVATSSASAFAPVAASDLETALPKHSDRATPQIHAVNPVLSNKLCQGQLLLQGQLSRHSSQSPLVQPCIFSSTAGAANCAIDGDAKQRPMQGGSGLKSNTADQTVSDVTKKSKDPLRHGSRASSQLQDMAGKKNSKTALASPFSAPRGLNGLLLSRSCKRKSHQEPLQPTKPQMQATSITVDLTLSDDDFPASENLSEINKRIKGEMATNVNMDDVESLGLMVEQVNQNLKEKPISVTQLERLQSAIDNVAELRALQRSELTDVLKTIGQLETIQMIHVRKYLQCL